MTYVNFGGKRVFYQVIRADEPEEKKTESVTGARIPSRPVMLLHGNTASGRMFDFVLPECGTLGNPLLVVDFLGHGRSDRLVEFPDDLWQDQARQTIEIIQQENLSDVVLIGTSGGAIVAVNAALLRPDLFAGVIADSFQGGSILSTEQFELIAKERGERLEDAENDEKVDQTGKESQEEVSATALWEYCHGEDWPLVVECDNALLGRLAGSGQSLLAGELTDLAVPTLFTALEDDELIPGSGEIARTCAQTAPQGSCHVFAQGSHPSMLTNWEEFRQVAKRFLTGL